MLVAAHAAAHGRRSAGWPDVGSGGTGRRDPSRAATSRTATSSPRHDGLDAAPAGRSKPTISVTLSAARVESSPVAVTTRPAMPLGAGGRLLSAAGPAGGTGPASTSG